MDLLSSTRQTVWRGPAVANFTLGGMGGGLYALLTVLGLAGVPGPKWLLALGPLSVLAGFLAVAGEAGRPWRGLYALRNLRASWMSRELAAGLLFVLLAALDLLLPGPALRGLATLAGLALILCQGFMLSRARGVPAWSVPAMPLMALTSGLISGGGLLLLLTGSLPAFDTGPLRLPLLTLLVVDTTLWLDYLHRPGGGPAARAVESLRSWRFLGLIVGIGRLLPMLLLVWGIVFPGPGSWATVGAGAAMLLGGVLQKRALILEAGWLIPIGSWPKGGDAWQWRLPVR